MYLKIVLKYWWLILLNIISPTWAQKFFTNDIKLNGNDVSIGNLND